MNYKANITLTKAKKKKKKTLSKINDIHATPAENDLGVVTYRINEGKKEILRTYS